MLTVNGVSLYVEDSGAGTPVVLLHGWPDSARLWRNQIPVLTDAGYRVIAPDQRGFGRSARPSEIADYRLDRPVGDVVGLLDKLGLETAHVIGHDWGAAVGWLLATQHPDRVRSLAALSVPHPASPRTLRQREMAWYQLFFLFDDVAEAWFQHDDWALFREFLRGDGDVEQYVEDLSRPGALTASLNWYRANLVPQPPPAAGGPSWPPVAVRTLGIWSERDNYLDGARMRASVQFVSAQWRYEQIPNASHWIPLDQPARLNELLLEWLAG